MTHSTSRVNDYRRLAATIPLIVPAIAGAEVISRTDLDIKIGFDGGVQHAANNVPLAMEGFITFSFLRIGGSNSAAMFAAHNLDFRSARPAYGYAFSPGMLAHEGATWSVDYTGRLDELGSSITQTGTVNRFAYVEFNAGLGQSSDERFLLLRANRGDGFRYGWLSLTTFFEDYQNTYVVVTGWGYETDGSRIAAGQTAPPVPGLGGLVALACGAGGLRRIRGRST